MHSALKKKSNNELLYIPILGVIDPNLSPNSVRTELPCVKNRSRSEAELPVFTS